MTPAGHAPVGGVSSLMGFRDRLVAVCLAAAMAGAGAGPALAQSSGSAPASPPPADPPQASQPPASPPPAQAPLVDAAELARLKRQLATQTPIFDAALNGPQPTFRVSVSEKVDIWKFWGEPEEVAAYVRPRGGSWHHEFQDMVTPDEFKGYGGIFTNSEKLQLATTGLISAAIAKLIGAGIRRAADARTEGARREAKEEVQGELAAFCAAHPGACTATPVTPP